MKMSPQMVERTLTQFEAEAVPENHPAVTQLNRLFGEHTFFIDGSGLNIVEPAESGDDAAQAGVVVKLAIGPTRTTPASRRIRRRRPISSSCSRRPDESGHFGIRST
jgi:hypothetical protein